MSVLWELRGAGGFAVCAVSLLLWQQQGGALAVPSHTKFTCARAFQGFCPWQGLVWSPQVLYLDGRAPVCQLQGCDTVALGGAPHMAAVSLVQQVTGRANSGGFLWLLLCQRPNSRAASGITCVVPTRRVFHCFLVGKSLFFLECENLLTSINCRQFMGELTILLGQVLFQGTLLHCSCVTGDKVVREVRNNSM